MRPNSRLWWLAPALGFGATLTACSDQAHASWDAQRAASYLDAREAWWAGWKPTARDQGTFCVSCHTALPYALARPALGAAGAPAAAAQRQLLENVSRRVVLWSLVHPYYPNQARASRATEAVLNALILSSEDARHGHLGPTTRAALEAMWALQETSGPNTGAWPWIQFSNEPWEAYDSAYYGAVLAALAVGTAPESYRDSAAIREPLSRLRGYLIAAYPTQSPLNRIMLLWASTRLPGLIDCERRGELLREIWSAQRADGGWSTGALVGAWRPKDGSTLTIQSDGFATGLILLALRDAAVPAEPRLERARTWLIAQQSASSGRWDATSLNRHRNWLFDRAAPFMDDAATAFAVLALTPSQGAQLVPGCEQRQTFESGNDALRRFM
jgi:squalene-hopene/tetraprenyl-beta-curcumene cyclase